VAPLPCFTLAVVDPPRLIRTVTVAGFDREKEEGGEGDGRGGRPFPVREAPPAAGEGGRK
jgi:hypothetical protein